MHLGLWLNCYNIPVLVLVFDLIVFQGLEGMVYDSFKFNCHFIYNHKLKFKTILLKPSYIYLIKNYNIDFSQHIKSEDNYNYRPNYS